MVEENTSMWITPQHLLVLSYGGQISSSIEIPVTWHKLCAVGMKRRVSQIGETWRDTTSEKLTMTKSYVAPELIVCGQSADHSKSERRCGYFLSVKA